VLSDRVAGPVSKDRDVFAHGSLLRWPMEILQISIRRHSVADATGSSERPSQMLFEDQTGSYRMRWNRGVATRKPASAAQSIGRRLM
jgi:hypothetical protein